MVPHIFPLHTAKMTVHFDSTSEASKMYCHMALTDLAARAAKPKSAPYRVTDSWGLYLLVKPTGGKLWRLDYRFQGARKTISLGKYPMKGLADVRRARDDAKEQIEKGIDPSAKRKLDKIIAIHGAANTFGAVAEEWLKKIELEGRARATLKKSGWFVELLTPSIGSRSIAEITAPELLFALRKIEARGKYETARRARSTSGRIFRYAIATGRAQRNPAGDLIGALITPKVKHHATITDPQAIGALLRSIDTLAGSPIVRAALLLLPLVFVRPIELRYAQWADIDLVRAKWLIPAAIMKMRKPHLVPLSRQAVVIIQGLQPKTGEGRYMFPSLRTNQRPLSENTLNAALRRLGYSGDEITSHGFRGMASTQLNEMGRWNPDAIERQLAHGEKDAVRSAYNHAQHLAERIDMMQVWADHLDELRLQLPSTPTVERNQ